MSNEKVFQMDFGKIYDLLLNKAVKKGRTKSEVDEVICWLTGYSVEGLEESRSNAVCYGDFFRNAPQLNPNRTLIKGVVCGVRVEEVADPLMREIRYLDKLIDELAKGKPIDKILRSYENCLDNAEKDYISRWKSNAKQHFEEHEYELICDFIIEHSKGNPCNRILEIGCGAGYSTLVFASKDLDVLAIDTKLPAMQCTKDLIEEYDYSVQTVTSSELKGQAVQAEVLLWNINLVEAFDEVVACITEQKNVPIDLIVLCNPGGDLNPKISDSEHKLLKWAHWTDKDISADDKIEFIHNRALIYAACKLSQSLYIPLLIVDRGSKEEVHDNLCQIQDDTGCRKIFEAHWPIKKAPKDGIHLSGINGTPKEQFWGAALYYPQ